MWTEISDLLSCFPFPHSGNHIAEHILGELVSAFAFCRMNSGWIKQQVDIMYQHIIIDTPNLPPQKQCQTDMWKQHHTCYITGDSWSLYGVCPIDIHWNTTMHKAIYTFVIALWSPRKIMIGSLKYNTPHKCIQQCQGALTFGHMYHTQACLTPKVQIFGLVRAFHTVLKHGTLPRPWHSWKSHALVWYGCLCKSKSMVAQHGYDVESCVLHHLAGGFNSFSDIICTEFGNHPLFRGSIYQHGHLNMTTNHITV